MTEMTPIVNAATTAWETKQSGRYGGSWCVLTRSGRLGANQMRLMPGQVTCPFHYHECADELFYVLSGRGVLRYGENLHEIGPGDCVSCPAGTKTAHQIANPFDEDLVYLAVGDNHPHEVCVYPDTGKILVRSLGRKGFLQDAEYLAGEPAEPQVFGLWAAQGGAAD